MLLDLEHNLVMRLFNHKINLKNKETRLQLLTPLPLLFGWCFFTLAMWDSLGAPLKGLSLKELGVFGFCDSCTFPCGCVLTVDCHLHLWHIIGSKWEVESSVAWSEVHASITNQGSWFALKENASCQVQLQNTRHSLFTAFVVLFTPLIFLFLQEACYNLEKKIPSCVPTNIFCNRLT